MSSRASPDCVCLHCCHLQFSNSALYRKIIAKVLGTLVPTTQADMNVSLSCNFSLVQSQPDHHASEELLFGE